MTITTVNHYGKVAQAMAQAYAKRQPGQDVKGQIPCPKCGSRVNFTVFPSGISYGHCVAAGCIKWST